jgi:hypothetical protein
MLPHIAEITVPGPVLTVLDRLGSLYAVISLSGVTPLRPLPVLSQATDSPEPIGKPEVAGVA